MHTRTEAMRPFHKKDRRGFRGVFWGIFYLIGKSVKTAYDFGGIRYAICIYFIK